MRILQVRFKNLNSLAGEWQIDFTHPAFASDGIFAITGPTGAGKTTLLDAICLALYGCTPRLGKITKSGNEIMTRHTGECFAEVEFETQSGRYRCHWSQHRARRKATGELQLPKHEIADAQTGDLLATSIRGVAQSIEQATGMDYERFTRSMLLAQGDFAAFLQADADTRAPILEQITGTEIYSTISIRVHEHKTEQARRLEALKAELDGMRMLSTEEETQCRAILASKTSEEVRLSRQLDAQATACNWLQGIEALEKELAELAAHKAQLQHRLETFAPQQQRLSLANQALELSGDYATLCSVRQQQQADAQALKQSRALLPERESAAQQAEEAMSRAKDELSARRAELHKALPLLRQVRALDLQISERDEPVRRASEALSDSREQLEKLRIQQQQDSAQLQTRQQDHQQVCEQLEQSRADEALAEELAGIRNRFELLRSLQQKILAAGAERDLASQQIEELERHWKKLNSQLEELSRKRDGQQQALIACQQSITSILDDKSLAQWRKALNELAAQSAAIKQAQASSAQLQQAESTLARLEQKKERAGATQSELSRQHKESSVTHTRLERECELLERQLRLVKRIEDLEAHREQLEDGQPCPLCGAKEHPYALGNIPVAQQAQLELDQVKTACREAAQTEKTLSIELARLETELKQLASAQQEHSRAAEQAKAMLASHCQNLPVQADSQELPQQLEQLAAKTTENHSRIETIIQDAEQAEAELARLREALEADRVAVDTLSREAQTAQLKRQSAADSLQSLEQQAARLLQEKGSLLQALQKELQVYGTAPLTDENLDAVHEQLSQRRGQWLQRRKRREQLDREIFTLTTQLENQKAEAEKCSAQLLKLEQQRDQEVQARRQLQQQRLELFTDKDADAEETRLGQALEAAEQALDSARRLSDEAHKRLAGVQSRIVDLERNVAEREQLLDTQENAFLSRLAATGFVKEAEYLAACLPEQERRDLARQAHQLATEETETRSSEREKTARLAAEREKQLTQENLSSLSASLQELQASHRELQQEIGGLRHRLADNETLKKHQAEKMQAIAAQQRECERWNLLHELIGSADGKKYRNFAQGLTFEMMIGHANQQLQKMTERYLLIRDERQPLELNVVDNYQAGEIRSTKNLSGGESFIVSLSLALGLSHMASRNVRVDSLFLDEGFGTLDEDALDTALETLSGLQQDGKLIGVISHVAELKERISTRIEIRPQTGGRSMIEGPGCEAGATQPLPAEEKSRQRKAEVQ